MARTLHCKPAHVRFSMLDRLLPPALGNDDLRRVRMLAGLNVLTFVLCVCAAVYWVVAFGPHSFSTVVIGATTLLTGTSLLLLRRSPRAAAVVLLTTTTAAVLAVAADHGGLHSPNLMLVGLPALFAALLGHRRTSVACAAFAGVAALGFYLAEANGLALPTAPPDSDPSRTLAFMMIVNLAAVTAMARLYDASRAHATEQLHDEIARREQTETELRLAHKLEAVGQLAAGIAHEINNPLQYVHDSVQFVGQSLPVLGAMLDGYRDVAELAASGQPAADHAKEALKREADSDVAFVLEELPGAVERTQEGLERIAGIVRAMRAYSSGQANEPAVSVDLNDCVRATLTLSQSEYRDVATIETDLAELPPIKGWAGELNLALLTIVVNAAHAVAETARATGAPGRITVKTRREGREAIVAISDNGPGIPVTIQHRIFDPFFTTKGPGHGTGHGLAMARKIVVERHGGKLTFQSTPGQGTTFEVRLPLAARVTPPTSAARAA